MRSGIRQHAARNRVRILLAAAASTSAAFAGARIPNASSATQGRPRREPDQLVGRNRAHLQDLFQANYKNNRQQRGIDNNSQGKTTIEELLPTAISLLSSKG